ncbi:MAG: bifunctional diaminohydroxyphosphoribosylaminopyrimidine deaminase/5-amino-6-(5-phosphoribosylamino)uracil reductase RibD [Muribaculaceae bacterium]|nr:bifunctional diaminohydroxyphosphoribosylaminopyrimidine deaminase/5-amino-6-(5-phosphoribosylamino)uracil reductase RibD [Muribaculaceae bacterium]
MINAEHDKRYMRRALQLALNGNGHVSPNPMVGAVIVAPDGRIIGEGWHRKYGGPHAEVNAVDSVSEADKNLLKKSTIYVTLEPCSHYGKTPPCAELLIKCGIARVVIGAGDPNPRVAGKGISMLKDAGIDVVTGILEAESIALNKKFMTAHRLRRPFITLKWARSADGFMDVHRSQDEPPARFSTPLTQQVVHQRRALHDAIAVGAGSILADNPSLNVRLIAGNNPIPIIFDRHGLIDKQNCKIYDYAIHITDKTELKDVLSNLFIEKGITSILVEGGAGLLKEFINNDLWDEAYEEISPETLGNNGCVEAPTIEGGICLAKEKCNSINFYSHNFNAF